MENEAINNLVFIGIPLDTVIVSGITSDCTVQVTATNGVIVIKRCDENCNGCNGGCNRCDEYENCYCLCDDCKTNLSLDESEGE